MGHEYMGWIGSVGILTFFFHTQRQINSLVLFLSLCMQFEYLSNGDASFSKVTQFYAVT